MRLCDDCIKGVRHEGTPSGKIERINGVQCYVATPQTTYAQDKVLLFLSDAIGMQLVNSQLMADDFAKNGFKTIIIDYFDGDGVPINELDANAPAPGFDLEAWFSRHPSAKVRALIDQVVQTLKDEGVSAFGATGYCFGGRFALDLGAENITKVTVISHPSLLDIPHIFEKLLAESKSPLLVNSCEVDQQFPIEVQQIVDKLLGNGAYKPGYARTFWEGCTHGFAVRGDMTNPQVKAGKEGSFEATVKFFQQYL